MNKTKNIKTIPRGEKINGRSLLKKYVVKNKSIPNLDHTWERYEEIY